MTTKGKKRRSGAAVGALCGALAVTLAAGVGRTSGCQGFEERAQGLVLAARGPRAWNPDVVVIAVDDSTLRELGWPIGRDAYAAVVHAVASAGARAIAFDIFLASPAQDPADDLALEGVAQASNRLVLAAECTDDEGDVPALRARLSTLPLAPAGPSPAHRCKGMVLPTGRLPDLSTLAHVNAAESASGNVRGMPLFAEVGGRRVPSLSLAAFLVGRNLSPAALEPAGNGVLAAGQWIPADATGAALSSFRGYPPGAVIPFAWLLSQLGRGPDGGLPGAVVSRLAGKYVLVGQTASSIGDHGPLATGQRLPLIALHAALLSDLLEDRPTTAWGWPAHLVLSLLAGALCVLAAVRVRPSLAVAMSAAVIALLCGGVALLAGWGQLVGPVAPALSAVLGLAVALAGRLGAEDRERRVLRSAFGAYVDQAVLERVLDDPDRYLSLGGAKKTLSVLFSDIKGYTGLSNELAPDQVVALLREYLEAMTTLVKKREGRVDKIMGDGILAVFGDPIPHEDHAVRAVEVGLSMQAEVSRLVRKWADEGKRGLAIRIGIATGEVFVGNIGSASAKIEYTVLGPTVNLASRLEGKAPPGGVLVSAETSRACGTRFSFQEVTGLSLKGYSEAYTAYLVAGPELRSGIVRAAPRIPVQAEVTVRAGGLTAGGRMENVSLGGLYVVADVALSVGEVVEIELAAQAPPGAAPVVVRGTVRHARSPADGGGFGVSIERADSATGEAMRNFIARFLGTELNGDGAVRTASGEVFSVELGELYGRLVRRK